MLYMKVDFYETGKRIMDILGAVVGIILFSPILIGGAVWVKLVSKEGPVLADIVDRVGKNRKPFRLYKFRSMIPNAQEWLRSQPELYKKYQDNGYKLNPDPRWIKGAKLLRKSSIDEMPQFFNVLKGDMSIVGPRPYYFFEIEEQLQRYPNLREYVDKAVSIKPGITGLWQVSGRSKVGFEDRVKLDAAYAEKKSLIFDMILILKSPYVIISGKGAS